MAQLNGQEYVARYGHQWNDVESTRAYVERADQEQHIRADAFSVMLSLIPFERDQPIRMLDIGTGQGTVAGLVLDAFPQATAVGLDVSEPMRQIASERMAAYGPRFRFHLGDFVDGDLPADLEGPFEVVASSRAIHHLPSAQKQRLYGAIYQVLTRGGAFFNLDTFAAPDPWLADRYRRADRLLRGRPAEDSTPRPARTGLTGHYWETSEDHLAFLRAAGFQPVDTFWKRLRITLIGGFKPQER